MEVSLSSEDAAFSDEVRAFIAANHRPEMRLPNPETDLAGVMGMTDELNVGHYLKTLLAINIQYGDPTFHVLRCAEDVFGSARGAIGAVSPTVSAA
jgi:hypothetical protein